MLSPWQIPTASWWWHLPVHMPRLKIIFIYSLWWTCTIGGPIIIIIIAHASWNHPTEHMMTASEKLDSQYGRLFVLLIWFSGWRYVKHWFNFLLVVHSIQSSVFISHILYPSLNSNRRPICIVNADARWLDTLRAKNTCGNPSHIYWMFISFKAFLLSHYLWILVSLHLLHCAKWVLLTAASVLEERGKERTGWWET